LGYLSTAVIGGPHLTNGFVREFLLAILLLTAGTGPALYSYFSKEFKNKNLQWAIPVLGVTILCFIFGQVILPNSNIFEITSKHVLEKGITNFSCVNGNCHIHWEYFNQKNQKVIPPFDHVIVNQYCASGIEGKAIAGGESGLTRHGSDFDFPVEKCAVPVKIEVYPLFLGWCGTGSPSLKFITCSTGVDSQECKAMPPSGGKPI
jgi:hypothetical protein